MAEDSGMFHELAEQLKPKTRDMHRAVVSVVEELQAIDWYAQRVDATGDADLRAILEHNANEEKEHAVMLLEWIRRQDPVFETQLRAHLFRPGPIVSAEEQAEATGRNGNGAASPSRRGSIGSLREVPRR
jgi:ferritin-like protein